MTTKKLTKLNFKRLGNQTKDSREYVHVDIPTFDLLGDHKFTKARFEDSDSFRIDADLLDNRYLNLRNLLIKLDEELDSLINEFVCLETKHLRTWQKSYVLNSYNLHFDLKHNWYMAFELSPSCPVDPYRYEVNLYKDFEYQNTIAVFKKDHVSSTEVTEK